MDRYGPNKKWWPGSSAETGLFGHGTSVGNGLAIAHDRGQMFTSRGKCGRGSYFFTADKDLSLDDAIAQLWGKTRSYNRGCLVVARMHGQCVSKPSSATKETEVPAGTFAKKKGCGEFSAHPKCVEIVSIIFVVHALVARLQDELHACGYSQDLHAALCRIVESHKRGTSTDTVVCANPPTLRNPPTDVDRYRALRNDGTRTRLPMLPRGSLGGVFDARDNQPMPPPPPPPPEDGQPTPEIPEQPFGAAPDLAWHWREDQSARSGSRTWHRDADVQQPSSSSRDPAPAPVLAATAKAMPRRWGPRTRDRLDQVARSRSRSRHGEADQRTPQTPQTPAVAPATFPPEPFIPHPPQPFMPVQTPLPPFPSHIENGQWWCWIQ